MGHDQRSTRVRAAFFKVARCPYCHDGVDAEVEDWVQCARCHALAHRACWGEIASCAACRGARTTAEEPVKVVLPRPTRPRRRLWNRSTEDAICSLGAM